MPQHKRRGKREVLRRYETAQARQELRDRRTIDEQISVLYHDRPGLSEREITRLVKAR